MNRKHIQDTFDYFLHFTEIYRTNENKYLREARILKLQIPHILQEGRSSCWQYSPHLYWLQSAIWWQIHLLF